MNDETVEKTLDDIIKDICDEIKPDAKEPKWRMLARKRLLACRCRQHVFDKLDPNKRPERGYTVLTKQFPGEDVADDLAKLARTIASQFPEIESLYDEAVDYTTDEKRLNLEKAGRLLGRGNDPRTFRKKVIWDVVWGLIASEPEWFLGKDGRLVAAPKRALIKEQTERRLRMIERIRYNAEPDRLPLSELQVFAYPTDSCRVGGKTYDSSTKDNPDWQQLWIDHPDDFKLVATDPTAAIKAIFEAKEVGGRAVMTMHYCDHVITIIQLEALVESLERTHNPEQLAQYEDRIGIITGWMPYNAGRIGSGVAGDPFFERKRVRIDELVPGDYFQVKNHPAYQAFAIEGDVWGLENALLTCIKDIAVPGSFEVQGHGLGPLSFRQMQAHLVNMVCEGVTAAQDAVVEERALDKALSEDNKRQPFVLAKLAKYGAHGDEYPIRVEFRSALRPQGAGAFAARWLSEGVGKVTEAELQILFTKKYRKPYQLDPAPDTTMRPEAWMLPYTTRLRLSTSRRVIRLEGSNLTRALIRSVYFVAYPRDFLKPGPDPAHPDNPDFALYSTSPGLVALPGYPGEQAPLDRRAVLGTWDGTSQKEVPSDQLREPDSAGEKGKWIEIPLPERFDQPQSYWRPVLRVSMFDPTDPELEPLLEEHLREGYKTQPVSWFEKLSEEQSGHRMIKNLVASMQLEFRLEIGFRWPFSANQEWVDVQDWSDQSSEESPEQYPIEGHSLFNVVFLPLYRMRAEGVYGKVNIHPSKPKRLKARVIATQLCRFFRDHAPEEEIEVIRPVVTLKED